MKQAYISPAMQVVQLKQSDIITESPQRLTVDFYNSTNDQNVIGAADRFRDWE